MATPGNEWDEEVEEEYLGLAHEAGWYDPNELVVPYSLIQNLLTEKDAWWNKHEQDMYEEVEKAHREESAHLVERERTRLKALNQRIGVNILIEEEEINKLVI
jgi:hypothetical protein